MLRRMSDESPRLTPGNAPQRRPTDAPVWWAELERSDLPGDRSERRGTARPGGDRPRPRPDRGAASRAEETARLAARPTAGSTHWLRTAISTMLVAFAALAIAWFGIGGGGGRSIAVVVLIFGVPAALAATIVTVVARKTS